MVDPAAVATLAVAGVASLFMAWSIGAGSSGSTPFAPAVGANAIPVMRAGFFVGLLGFAGAVLQGAAVSEAVGSELVVGGTLTPLAAIIALATAATLVAVGVFTGYPIATAFTVTGAVVGAGLALGRGPAWAKYQEIGTLWVLVPFVGGGIAYGTARLLRDIDRDRYTIPVLAAVVGAIVANIGFVFLGPAGESVSMAGALAGGTGAPVLVRAAGTLALALFSAGALAYDMAGSSARGQQHFLLALGALVAFSAGGTQVGLAVGPLIPLIETGGSGVPMALLALGGAGLLVGSWTGAPRMIKALSQDYSSLGPRRSIAALIPSFAIAQTAVFFGIPVSFNEIIVSAIVGSGYAAGRAGVSRRKMVFTVLAWVGSLVLAFGASYVAFAAASAAF
ncbi:MAG: anion permease [Halobacteriaceae archaeon]